MEKYITLTIDADLSLGEMLKQAGSNDIYRPISDGDFNQAEVESGQVQIKCVPYVPGERPDEGVEYPSLIHLCALLKLHPHISEPMGIIAFGSSYFEEEMDMKVYPHFKNDGEDRTLAALPLDFVDEDIENEELLPFYYLAFCETEEGSDN